MGIWLFVKYPVMAQIFAIFCLAVFFIMTWWMFESIDKTPKHD